MFKGKETLFCKYKVKIWYDKDNMKINNYLQYNYISRNLLSAIVDTILYILLSMGEVFSIIK